MKGHVDLLNVVEALEDVDLAVWAGAIANGPAEAKIVSQ
jgi:hypothetical protein